MTASLFTKNTLKACEGFSDSRFFCSDLQCRIWVPTSFWVHALCRWDGQLRKIFHLSLNSDHAIFDAKERIDCFRRPEFMDRDGIKGVDQPLKNSSIVFDRNGKFSLNGVFGPGWQSIHCSERSFCYRQYRLLVLSFGALLCCDGGHASSANLSLEAQVGANDRPYGPDSTDPRSPFSFIQLEVQTGDYKGEQAGGYQRRISNHARLPVSEIYCHTGILS